MSGTIRVRRRGAASLLLLGAGLAAAPAAASPADFDKAVEAARSASGIPGMAIAFVENGRPTLVKGYGVGRLGGREAVTPDTLFPNGWTGKAFTVAALAQLVDAGKLGWDDRVVDRLPGFQMYDPWVTREMTMRDLLVHHIGRGLGAGDLLFVPSSNLSRAETVRRLRYIRPVTTFRSGYAYDNFLYMVAGQLIEAVTGQTWEAYVAEHVLKRGGINRATSNDAVRFSVPNRAQPHARLGEIRGNGDQVPLDERETLGRNAAPAGGLAVSASDVAHWLTIQLAHGALPEGGRLFSERASREAWNPVMLTPAPRTPADMKAAEPMFSAYALGWQVNDYKGAKIVQHSGAVFEFQAIVVLILEKDVGFFILINSEDSEAVRGLTCALLDHYLDKPTQDWLAAWRAYKAKRVAQGLAVLRNEQAKLAKVGPSPPLSRYAGDYTEPWCEPTTIRQEGGKLRIDFRQSPGLTGTPEHWQYDSFRTQWSNPAFEPAFVTFGIDSDGKVARVSMRAASPIADFSWDYQDLLFTPVAAAK